MVKDEYISGEEHKAMASTKKRTSKKVTLQPLQLTIGVIVIVALSFYGGSLYQKHHQPKITTASSTQPALGQGGSGFGQGGGQRFGGGQRGAFGKVTAVSSTSITIANQRTNKDSTLSITDQTMITNNGQTAAASDIKVGDTVVVMASSSNSSQAARILLNPSFGGGGANPTSDSRSDQAPTQLN